MKRGLIAIGDLKPDPTNRRHRTPRAARMLEESIERLGAARSIVIDENDEILAGNGVVEAAAEVGITQVQIIEGDGKTLVAVRRRNLSPEDKRALALYDNRTGELAEWNPEQLEADRKDGLPLATWFTEGELKRELGDLERQAKVRELATGEVTDRFWIAVRGPLKSQAKALQQLRTVMRDIEGVEVDLGLTATPDPWE
jgi:hypothetical protein